MTLEGEATPAAGQDQPAAQVASAAPGAEPTKAVTSTPAAQPATTETTKGANETTDSKQKETNDDSAAAGHIPMADRLSLVSWGEGSAPSMPSVDDSSSEDGRPSRDVVRSTTTSLRSSVYDYVEENGRTYHRFKEGKYPLPNDLQEQARLDLQHAIFVLMAHGKSFLAPLDKPKRVLDFATGTGIWAIEFAMQFPDAYVLGTDLSPIQPDFVPPNCHFEIDDAEDEWSFPAPFDYVHGRALVSCFRDPAAVIRSAYGATAPGGYLELQDGHFPIKFATQPPPNCALKRWDTLIQESAALGGRPWTNCKYYKQWMEEAGFVDVVERRFYWPFNPWPRGAYYKTLGAYVLEDLLNGLEGLSLKLLSRLGWTYDEVQKLLVDVRRDLLDTKVHAYVDISIIWGRKPGGEEPAKAAETATATVG